ncbi:MAG: LacI family transcriptional regulator [Planctomycetota bacterium]|nr:LacI family transcriptional regulator [Planctomycetota bacterium]
MRDIARAAGVSTATVSRVLSGSADVSDDLRRKVRSAAAALNYRPEKARRGKRARAAKAAEPAAAQAASLEPPAGAAGNVLLYIPDTHAAALHDRSVGYFAYVFSGVLSKVQECGLTLSLTPYPAGELAGVLMGENLERLKRGGVKGLLFLFSNAEEDALLLDSKLPLPWIALNRKLEGAELTVRQDERGGAYAAGKHLAGLGHARVGVLAGPKRFQFFEERLEGFREGLKDAGVKLPPDLIARSEFSREDGAASAQRLLALKEPPTALFATEEEFAVGALRYAEKEGLQIPGDFSLVAYSDFVLSARRGMAVTAVSTPAFELGYLAVEALINRSRIANPMRLEIVLQPALVVRQSVDAPRPRNGKPRS